MNALSAGVFQIPILHLTTTITHTHTHTHTHMLPDSVSMVSRASHALASAGKPQSRKLQVSNMNRGKKLPSKVGQKPQSCCPENVKWYLEVLMKLSFSPHPMTEPLHKMCWLIGVQHLKNIQIMPCILKCLSWQVPRRSSFILSPPTSLKNLPEIFLRKEESLFVGNINKTQKIKKIIWKT